MPAGRYRSRSLRRIFVKAPGGQVRIHYRSRKPSRAKCAHCHHPLTGVPRELPSVMRHLPKTAKRPERPYGGNLCSSCTRALLREKAREDR